MEAQKKTKWYQKLSTFIVGIITLLVGLLLLEQRRRKKAELRADTIETDIKDSMLEVSKEAKENAIKANDKTIKELKKTKEEVAKEQDLKTTKEVEDFYNSKFKKK